MSTGSASFVDPTAGAVEHCQAMSKALGADSALVQNYYEPMAAYCQEKLWHQLTVRVLEFVHDPAAAAAASSDAGGVHPYLAVYDKVVLAVDRKLDPLQLARIAAAVATALHATDATAAKAVLENLLQKYEDEYLGVSATIYVQSRLALQQLHAMSTTSSSDNEQAKQEQLEAILKQIRVQQVQLRDADHPALVHAAHYEQAMTYYKVVGPPEAFFAQAMHFLQYAPVPSSSADSASSAAAATASSTASSSSSSTNYHQLAVDLVLAALTGEGVYNLSQVVQEQSALLELLNTPPAEHAWLLPLLTATAGGHVETFQQLVAQHSAAVQQQPALVHRAAAVQEKLTLLAVVDLVFQTPAHERLLSFETIAAHCHCPLDQVEWILMRALSVKLIEGRMDQVAQQVHVTWVIPTTLNPQQLNDLGRRFGEWADKVKSCKTAVQEQTAETFA